MKSAILQSISKGNWLRVDRFNVEQISGMRASISTIQRLLGIPTRNKRRIMLPLSSRQSIVRALLKQKDWVHLFGG